MRSRMSAATLLPVARASFCRRRNVCSGSFIVIPFTEQKVTEICQNRNIVARRVLDSRAMEWMMLPFKRYADFSGRSRRREYWMFTLFNILVFIAIAIAGGVIGATTGDDDMPPLMIFG